MPRPKRRNVSASTVSKHVVERRRRTRGRRSSCSLQELSNKNDDDQSNNSSTLREDSNGYSSSTDNRSDSSTSGRRQMTRNNSRAFSSEKSQRTRAERETRTTQKKQKADHAADEDFPSNRKGEEESSEEEEEDSDGDAGSNYSDQKDSSDEDNDDENDDNVESENNDLHESTSDSDDSEPLTQKLKRKGRTAARNSINSKRSTNIGARRSSHGTAKSTKPGPKRTKERNTSKAQKPTRNTKASSHKRKLPTDDDSLDALSSEGEDSPSVQDSEKEEMRSNYPTRRRMQRKGNNDAPSGSSLSLSVSSSEKKTPSLTSPSARRSSPVRASAEKASKKFASIEHTYDDLESEESNDDNDNILTTERKRTGASGKKAILDSDYSVEEDAESASSSLSLEDENISKKADDSEEELNSFPQSNQKAREVRNSHINAMKVRDEDIGDEESSSSSGEEDKEEENTGISAFSRDDGVTLKSPFLKKKSPSPSKKRHRVPCCPSKEDAITFEPLPAPPEQHVCYVTPDGATRECFKLETLHKIALTQRPQYRKDALGTQIRTFSQPPHFRAPMSDELLEQIADRFGRSALDLHGLYYQTKTDAFGKPLVSGGINHYASAWGRNDLRSHMITTQETRSPSTDSFQELVNNYWQSRMGNQDVYVCPLCYTVSHALLRGVGPSAAPWKESDKDQSDENDAGENDTDSNDSDDEDQDDNDHKLEDASTNKIEEEKGEDGKEESGETNEEFLKRYPTTDFKEDPLSVLGNADDDRFQVAGGFSFRKISDCKIHLQTVHDVNTRSVKGSDLYMRFKVRAPDGLLQRWIKGKYRQYTKQGYLQRYWYDGNNSLFVHLLHQMMRFEECQRILEENAAYQNEGARTFNSSPASESSEEARRRNAVRKTATDFLLPTNEFAMSFHKDAKRLWDEISAPYSNVMEKEDMENFVDNGDEAEQGEGEYIASQEASFRRMENSHLEEELQEDKAYVDQLEKRFNRQREKGRTKDNDNTDEGEDGADDDGGSESENESMYAGTSEDDEEDSDDADELEDEVDENDEWMKERQAPPGKRIQEEKKRAAEVEAKTTKKVLRRSPTSKANGVVTKRAKEQKNENESEDDGIFSSEDDDNSRDKGKDPAMSRGQESSHNGTAFLEDSDDE